jgi:tetratricopeptide (TPR) repeat protein
MTFVLVAILTALQPAESAEDERARQAYEAGRAAYQLGNFEEAAKRFEEAYRIVRIPAVLFSTAQCHRRIFEGQHVLEHARKAIELYQAFLRDAAADADNRGSAKQFISELSHAIASEANGREALPLADSLMADGALEDAALLLDRTLSARGNSREVLLGALQRRGLVAARAGQVEIARGNFARALALDPSLQLANDADQPTASAWADAQKQLADRKPLGLSHVPPKDVRPGQAAHIVVQPSADPLGLISQFVAYYRIAGRNEYSSVRVRHDVGTIEIAPALPSPPGGARVEYYLAALDALDSELVLDGSPERPFAFAIVSPASGPNQTAEHAWYRRWWVWSLVGGAAIAGVTGAYLATRTDNSATIHLPP